MKLAHHLTIKNSRPRCPEVLIKGTQAGLMRRGETISDIKAAMERPSWQQ